MPKPFDFAPELLDPDVLLGLEAIRSLVENEIFSVANMSDEEIRESIVQDILLFTMWEIQTGVNICFNRNHLLMFVQKKSHKDKILVMMEELIRHGLIGDAEGEIRIVKDQEVLQRAMDFCGVWYSGFKMQEGAIVVGQDYVDMKIEDIENLASSLSQDMQANAPFKTTVQ